MSLRLLTPSPFELEIEQSAKEIGLELVYKEKAAYEALMAPVNLFDIPVPGKSPDSSTDSNSSPPWGEEPTDCSIFREDNYHSRPEHVEGTQGSRIEGNSNGAVSPQRANTSSDVTSQCTLPSNQPDKESSPVTVSAYEAQDKLRSNDTTPDIPIAREICLLPSKPDATEVGSLEAGRTLVELSNKPKPSLNASTAEVEDQSISLSRAEGSTFSPFDVEHYVPSKAPPRYKPKPLSADNTPFRWSPGCTVKLPASPPPFKFKRSAKSLRTPCKQSATDARQVPDESYSSDNQTIHNSPILAQSDAIQEPPAVTEPSKKNNATENRYRYRLDDAPFSKSVSLTLQAMSKTDVFKSDVPAQRAMSKYIIARSGQRVSMAKEKITALDKKIQLCNRQLGKMAKESDLLTDQANDINEELERIKDKTSELLERQHKAYLRKREYQEDIESCIEEGNFSRELLESLDCSH